MNDFDMHRIENAIWTLKQYDYEIRQIIKEDGFAVWDGEKLFNLLDDVEEHIKTKIWR